MSSEPIQICPYPFARLEDAQAGFTPCCRDWLRTEKLWFLEKGEDIWNGPQAQEMRRRMLKGDLSFCRRERCQTPLVTLDELKANPAVNVDAPIPLENLEAMNRGEVVLPSGPSSINMTVDPRCNLKCPSCRTDYIHTLSARTETEILASTRLLERSRNELRVLRMAGYGEVFFTPFLRKTLKDVSRDRYPNLDYVAILSNGLLFNEKTMMELAPGSQFIKSVSISIDAADEQTYRDVRGGDWNRLLRNLEWISEQRKSGRFSWFSIQFVIRKRNFRTIPDFIELGRKLNVDLVYFAALKPWAGTDAALYEQEAIHLAGHPLRSELLGICEAASAGAKVRVSMERF